MLTVYFQCAALGLALLLAATLTPRQKPSLRRLSAILAWLAAKPRLAVTVSGLAGFAAAAGLTLVGGVPAPFIHDEFSYLLGGETLAQGRAANPAHPMATHFESFHIIVEPTYASKYPPGHALMLAAGHLVGLPIAGAWLEVGLACGTLCWMLQAWLPGRWALLGGLLAATQSQMLISWGYSYMGTALAMAGGCLVYGGYGRLRRLLEFGPATAMGLGLGNLANTRPYEGLLLSLPVALMLARRAFGPGGWGLRPTMVRLALPILAVLTTVGALTALYNRAITTDPLVMPYVLHDQKYMPIPVFNFMPLRQVPPSNHPLMEVFFGGWPLSEYLKQQTIDGMCEKVGAQFLRLWLFYVLPAFTLGLLAVPFAWREPGVRVGLFGFGCVFVGLVAVVWRLANYAAPAAGLLFLIVLPAMRRLRTWRPGGKRVGRFIVSSAILIHFASYPVLLTTQYARRIVVIPKQASTKREQASEDLRALGGKHLVIVYYGPNHDPVFEWVYNAADIDNAPVVWARGMGAERDQELIEYFRDRRVWVLIVNDPDQKLEELRRSP